MAQGARNEEGFSRVNITTHLGMGGGDIYLYFFRPLFLRALQLLMQHERPYTIGTGWLKSVMILNDIV